MSTVETLQRTRDDAEQEVVPVHIEMREFRSLGSLATLDGTPLPEPGGDGRRTWLFIVTVVLPVVVAGIYLFFIASDRYQSEVRFIVRSTEGSGMSVDAGGSMLGASLSRAGEDAYIVDDYITSRDALARLIDENDMMAIVSRPEADVFARFKPFFASPSRERLYDYYKSMVTTSVDSGTGISTIEVTAFRPGDAHLLAKTLLGYAESVVNRINDRANRDRVTYAEQILAQAKQELAEVEQRLTAFRSASGTVDPGKEYASALQNIGRLSTEASELDATLSQQMALTPNGPGIASLREKVRSLRDEIARQNRKIVGGDGSLAPKFAAFDQLSLEREVAAKELATAETNLEISRKEAGQQRLYLQPIVEPNLPDRPEGPKRLMWFAIVVGVSLALFVTAKKVVGLTEDHVV